MAATETRLRPVSAADVFALRYFADEHRPDYSLHQIIMTMQRTRELGGKSWASARSGYTCISRLAAWYQHIHRPGSREWRAAIIIDAACRACGIAA